MLDPPDVSQETILAVLRAQFGVIATALEPISGGEDSSAWVYRARLADGPSHLLKLRRGEVNWAGLAIPHYLQEQGLPHIVAPASTRTGALWAAVEAYVLMQIGSFCEICGWTRG